MNLVNMMSIESEKITIENTICVHGSKREKT